MTALQSSTLAFARVPTDDHLKQLTPLCTSACAHRHPMSDNMARAGRANSGVGAGAGAGATAGGARAPGGAGSGIGGGSAAPFATGSFASFRALVNRDGFLPRDDLRWSSAESRLVEVVGLDRGRLNFEGVFLNAMCSLRRLGLRNVSGGTVVVRLGSTVGDQLRWQLRNDNLDVLREFFVIVCAGWEGA